MHQLRRYLRVLAATVLVLVSSLGAWSAIAHGLDCHDRDADDVPIVVAHDASAHAFRAATPPDDNRPLHCVLCHWTRVFGPGVESVSATPSIVGRSIAVPADDAAAARPVSAVQPPLRAPPSAFPLDIVA